MKTVFVVAIAWILSLLTTAAVFYFLPENTSLKAVNTATKIVRLIEIGEKDITSTSISTSVFPYVVNLIWILKVRESLT